MLRAFVFAVLLLFGSAAQAQTANLWIDTNGGTCTRQGTPATYSDAAACSSMSAAITACTAGDTIRMKAGTYGGQIINVIKTTPGCTIIAEAGTTLTGEIHTHGAWYEIQNIDAPGWSLDNTTGGDGTNNITCRDCRFTGNGGVYWVAANNDSIKWIGGSLSNFECSACAQAFAIWSGETENGTSTGTNGLVEGVTFDDIVNTGGDGNHFEVIRIDGLVSDLTLRRNTFTNNWTSTAQIFMSAFRGDSTGPSNVLYENNFIGTDLNPAVAYSFQMNFQNKSSCANWTFRYNTHRQAMIDATSGSCSGTFSNIVWLGNLMPRGNCQGNTFNYNHSFGPSGSACSGTGNSVDTEAAVNFDADGFHILTGSSAIGAGGSGADCIATDHDGNSRSDPCDAGAHQFTTGGGEEGDPVSHRIPWHWFSGIALLLGTGIYWRYGNGKGCATSHGGGAVAARVRAGARGRQARGAMVH